MEYRAIRPDEVPVWRQFQEYSFNMEPAAFDTWMQHKFQMQHTRSLFAESGEMLATCANYPFDLYIEGARITMGGIASVASVPENRRGGYVGQLLMRLIGEMKEQGIPLSGLYAFKESFYRRYGWDVASAWMMHDIPVELLGAYRKSGGVIRRYLPGAGAEDWQTLNAVYEQWARPQRGAMVRETEFHWKNWVFSPMPQSRYHTAVWAPAPGAEPEGYMLYRLAEEEGKLKLIIREMVTLSASAERGLWGFAANHDSQVKVVRARTTRTYPLWHLVENTYDVKSELHTGWQLRLIDVKAAFEGRLWAAQASGVLTIALRDEHAPWNDGTWRLSLEEGWATVEAAPAETADLSTDVQTLSQLYAGFIRPEEAVRSERLAVSDRRALRLLDTAIVGDEMRFFEYF